MYISTSITSYPCTLTRMSTGEDEDSVTLESVNSVTLTQDSDGSIILHCPPHEGDESFEVTMTTTADSDITEEGVAQIQILQSSDPQNSEEISPVSQAWFTTKEDKDTLVNKGHKWKQGMWSKEEIDLLMSNIQHYVKGRGMEDPAEIIFEMSKEERKDFYRSVAWGLNRPLFAVYRRVLRMYDNRNHVGKYSPEEINKLKELRQKHGNDWATIGAALGRSASSVKDRCRLMKDTCNTGQTLDPGGFMIQEAGQTLYPGGFMIQEAGQTLYPGGFMIQEAGQTLYPGGVMIQEAGQTLYPGGFMIQEAGQTLYPGGFMIQEAGQTLYPGGFMIQEAGQILYPGGFMIQEAGQTLYPGGFMIQEAGQILYPGGFMIQEAGQILYPGGFMIQEAGQILYPGGFMIQEAGQTLYPGGFMIQEAGQTLYPGGFMIQEAGQILYPGGFMIQEAGQTLYPGGFMIQEAGQILYPGGFMIQEAGQILYPGGFMIQVVERQADQLSMKCKQGIVELDVDDENELKWEELAGGWSSVRSPQWLRSKWWSIKRQVANHKELPFHVLLKGLQELMETQVPLGAGTGPGSPSPSLQIRVTRLEECCSSAPRPVTALQIPLQITHLASDSAGASDTETITLNTAALQTLQILPSFHLHPTGTPGTYFLQTAANQSLPLSLSSNPTVTLTASSSPSSPEHIILHSLSTEGLCSNDSVIIQTVTSDHTSPEPLCQSQLVVEMQGEEPEQNFLIGSSEDGATETPEPMTDSFTAKVLDSPSQEEHSGIAKGAVLIVSPTNVSSTLTDLILENQDGSD
ncbi:cyclin-D-binding Myb-like transcription factor 1 [Salvelinus namaycush]|uniref:Cyclin-D-binding Myb-like transcription factor 1 n=1 Tax=Salvelinus namaycush TaxID=8040 RepID=A0A8U0QCI1_SALNM|nr:cyclin-D-binding Myb-like transcription factor 1 [Salvelinus namaycush]